MSKRYVAAIFAALLAGASISFADAPPATPPRHVDLLKLFDLSKDVRSGSWLVDSSGNLSTPKSKGARVEFPYAPPAEYDFRIVFSTTGDKAQLSALCSANHHQFGWMLGGWDGKIAGFHNVDGKNADKNPSTKKSDQWIAPGHDHTTLIKVRKDGVQALLDDHPVSYFPTDYTNMTLGASYKMNAGDSIGLDVRSGDMKITTAEIIEISGPGTALRGTLAAAVPPPPTPAPAPPAAAPTSPATAPAVANAPPSPAPATPGAALKVPLNATADDAKQLFEAGQYQDTQTAINRVLNGPPGAYDRDEMLTLRAECLIQTKQFNLAMQVLDGVCKNAIKVADNKDAAKAGALYFMLKLSPGGIYTPLTTDDKTPINIADRTLRKVAYLYAFDDQLAMCNKKIKDADTATTVAPLIEISETFRGLRYLEKINTGANKKTDPIAKKLSAMAIIIINRSLEDDKKIVAKISESANHLVRVNTSVTLYGNGVAENNSKLVRVGLTHPQVGTLQDIDLACQRVVQTCGDFIVTFDSHTGELRDTASRAGKVAENAETVLNGHEDPGDDVYVKIPKL